jgi:hypothetical protein
MHSVEKHKRRPYMLRVNVSFRRVYGERAFRFNEIMMCQRDQL